MKNLNSFKSVARAIEYEANRQIEELEKGNKIVQETRKWDDEKGISFSMRSKEDSQDYRYFPDPDLLTVKIDREKVEQIKKTMPLTQEQRIDIYKNKYNLPDKDTNILSSSKLISDFYDECVSLLNEPKEISNWTMTDVLKNDCSSEMPITPQNLVAIIKLLLDKKITRNNAKELFEKVIETKQDANELAQKMDMLSTISDQEIKDIVEKLVAENPKAVADFEKTPDKICMFFVGNVMKATRGKADAQLTKQIIMQTLQK